MGVNMKKVINQIRQIDNMADLNAVINAVKDQQKLLRNGLAREARASFGIGDSVSFNGRRGRMSGEIVKIKIKKAIVSIDGQRWDVPLTMLEVA